VRGHCAHQERVAVGRGLGDDLRAEVAARAGAVLDDDLLAEPHRELRREDAADDVGGAAGRERDDHRDDLVGPGRGNGGAIERQRGRRDACGRGKDLTAVDAGFRV
jgi:hypothetical protein